VVEDNATNCKILHEQLTSWDIGNGGAESGPRALQMLRLAAEDGEPYDVAILDMKMPGMDGMELARAIKADPAISSTRLVLLTSMGRRGDSAEARQAGIEAYLTKPVKQSELYDTLATVIGAPENTPEKDPGLVTRRSLRERVADSRVRILVTEDNAVNQKVAVRMMEKLGYRADVAANGLEALEALSRGSYEAILMGVQMPEMDGYAATKEIREREGTQRHTPIIAMTANAMQGDREKAIEEGMDDYVSKPVKLVELGAVLERWVSKEDEEEAEADTTTPAREVGEGSVDLSVLLGLRELQEVDEPDILNELIELFVKEVPSELEALREAAQRGDAQNVEQIAHTLKGSSANMGAIRMEALCTELEEMGRSEELAAVPAQISRLEEEFGRVRAVLEEELSEN
jgi:two-component system, sensor histidine kinase and response regulator